MVRGTAERRRHRLFVTRHTEYHVHDDECVGVRDRESGSWLRDHAALRLQAVTLPPSGDEARWVGRRLQFIGNQTDVLTSPIVTVGRPPKPSLEHYVSLTRVGEIRL
jgi:hypothetical protein